MNPSQSQPVSEVKPSQRLSFHEQMKRLKQGINDNSLNPERNLLQIQDLNRGFDAMDRFENNTKTPLSKEFVDVKNSSIRDGVINLENIATLLKKRETLLGQPASLARVKKFGGEIKSKTVELQNKIEDFKSAELKKDFTIEKLTESRNNFTRELSMAENYLQSYQIKILSLSKKISEMHIEIDSVSEDSIEHKKAKEELENKVKELEKSDITLNEQIKNYEKEIMELRDAKDEAENLIKEKEALLKTATENHSKEVSDHTKVLSGALSHNAALKVENISLDQGNKKLVSEVDKTKSEKQQMEEDNRKELRERVLEKKKDIESDSDNYLLEIQKILDEIKNKNNLYTKADFEKDRNLLNDKVKKSSKSIESYRKDLLKSDSLDSRNFWSKYINKNASKIGDEDYVPFYVDKKVHDMMLDFVARAQQRIKEVVKKDKDLKKISKLPLDEDDSARDYFNNDFLKPAEEISEYNRRQKALREIQSKPVAKENIAEEDIVVPVPESDLEKLSKDPDWIEAVRTGVVPDTIFDEIIRKTVAGETLSFKEIQMGTLQSDRINKKLQEIKDDEEAKKNIDSAALWEEQQKVDLKESLDKKIKEENVLFILTNKAATTESYLKIIKTFKSVGTIGDDEILKSLEIQIQNSFGKYNISEKSKKDFSTALLKKYNDDKLEAEIGKQKLIDLGIAAAQEVKRIFDLKEKERLEKEKKDREIKAWREDMDKVFGPRFIVSQNQDQVRVWAKNDLPEETFVAEPTDINLSDLDKVEDLPEQIKTPERQGFLKKWSSYLAIALASSLVAVGIGDDSNDKEVKQVAPVTQTAPVQEVKESVFAAPISDFDKIESGDEKEYRMGYTLIQGGRFNPCGLRYANQVGAKNVNGFAIFENINQGWTACLRQIEKYQDGTTANKNPDGSKVVTLEQFVNVWAPKNENDTNGYLNKLSKILEVDKNKKIAEIDYRKLAMGVIRMEGYAYTKPEWEKIQVEGKRFGSYVMQGSPINNLNYNIKI